MTLTEEQMNAIADEFENDTFQHEEAPVYTGSHYGLVNPVRHSGVSDLLLRHPEACLQAEGPMTKRCSV